MPRCIFCGYEDAPAGDKYGCPDCHGNGLEPDMREITTHHDGTPASKAIRIFAGEPGPGGAPTVYEVHVEGQPPLRLQFQDGPVGEAGGVNGITNETLKAIDLDRLRCWQAGPYANDFNARAIQQGEASLAWLHQRTKNRVHRQVEGTDQV